MIVFISNECLVVIVLFKQKTAYEMRISDWSSDVCSSDLEIVVVSLAEFQLLKISIHPGSYFGRLKEVHRGFGNICQLTCRNQRSVHRRIASGIDHQHMVVY